MSTPEKVGELLFRHTRNELSRNDKAALTAWRNESSGNEQLFQTATDPEQIRKRISRIYEDRDYVFQKLQEKFPQFEYQKTEKLRPRFFYLKRIAASVLLISIGLYSVNKWQEIGKPGSFTASFVSSDGILHAMNSFTRGWDAGTAGIKVVENEKGELTYIVPSDRKASLDKYNKIVTPRGGEVIVNLSDGSVVWLNAESSLKYPLNFSKDTIYLEVQGEAYFEIAQNSKKTFIISLPSTVNRAPSTENAGSHFNIRNYPDEPQNITTINNPAQNGNDVIAWKNGITLYHNADIQTIMRDISRWYDVTIDYVGTIPDKKYNLNIPRDANLKEVIRSLREQGAHVSFFLNKITVGP
ncbi:MAG TPA: FecR family protein [Puia sp.]|nr:FecR family protein [Puia sp.]